jgi:outer membrane protein insertion porin family
MSLVGKVRRLALASLILAGALFSYGATVVVTADVSFAQPAVSIVVQGNQRVDAETIRSYFRPEPGERLDAARIDAGLRALFATGLFEDVRVSRVDGRLVVTVVENPVINRVAFEGNRRLTDEQLRNEIQSRPRGTFSRPMVQADVARILDIYRRHGRFEARVTPQIIELPNNRVDLVFEIQEGEKTGVKRIDFVGNQAYSGYRLRDVIRTSESHLLSFLQTTDIYDPDRIEADRELLRRFYLRNGYADIRVVSATAHYDPGLRGFIVTFVLDEGPRYRVGTVELQSNVRALDPERLRRLLRTTPGSWYNAEAVERTVEDMTIEASRQGFAFATVRPRGERNFAEQTINLTYLVEEGPRVYIERINIRGNTRTRDYVIRREFDIAEGDAYNRVLIDRAERRLNNLDYFTTVRITNEPGSAPDRIIVNVDVVEKATGEFSIAGGYSTAEGFIGEVSIAERNLLGRGLYARAAVTYGQRVRGFELSFVEPYFLGYRMAVGVDLFSRQTLASSFISYDTRTLGGSGRIGFGLTENLSVQLRYSAFEQEVRLPPGVFVDCVQAPLPVGCASLPIRLAFDQGAVLTSLAGYTLAYNTLDNNRNPTSGIYAELRQDIAGLGGDVNFLRTTADARYYHELFGDLVGHVRVQGGHVLGWGRNIRGTDSNLRMLDHFLLGPTLVRGFAPAGLGPRDLTPGPGGVAVERDAIGGTMYWGASVEVQMPLYFLPKEAGIKVAAFADAGSLWNYRGPTRYTGPTTQRVLSGETMIFRDEHIVRSSVGASLIWDSPFGPLRFDYAFPLTKAPYDRVQQFRFGGGTRF